MSAAFASQLARVARTYAELGLAVLPLHNISVAGGKCSCGKLKCSSPGKHPRTGRGLNDATADAVIIERWWRTWADANVGIATGTVSGIVVLDVDPRHGGNESLGDLQLAHGPLPKTPIVITGGSGKHIFFRHPGGHVPNSSGALASGIDVRGDGGYVVAPPSNHVSGNFYSWEPANRIDKEMFAAAPDWLLALIRKLPNEEHTGRPSSEWVELIRGPVAEGMRNDALARIAGHLLRIRALHPAIAAELVQAVNEARCNPPLGADEVQAIVESIAGRELARSRERTT
jgi:hypothetical protein